MADKSAGEITVRELGRAILGNINATGVALIDTLEDETLPGHLRQINLDKFWADCHSFADLIKATA